jgi:hypothetical protein
MNKKEIKEMYKKKDELLFNIITKGKIIAKSTIDSYNKYYLLDNIVWYVPYGQYAINDGTLENFTARIKECKLKAKFI